MLTPKKGLLLVVPVKLKEGSSLIPEHLQNREHESKYCIVRHVDEFLLVEKIMVEEFKVLGEKFWLVEEKYVVGTLDKNKLKEMLGE